jgi:hypothetical protein
MTAKKLIIEYQQIPRINKLARQRNEKSISYAIGGTLDYIREKSNSKHSGSEKSDHVH